jgi:type IV pilus assembly protein PilV
MYAMRTSLKQQAGFSLIEVLVAVLILAFALLGLVGLQTRASQFSVESSSHDSAISLANEMASQMYTLRQINLPAVAPATYANWQAKVQNPALGGLPSGTGQIVVVPATATAPTRATITVTWQKATDPVPNRYVTAVPLVPGVTAP